MKRKKNVFRKCVLNITIAILITVIICCMIYLVKYFTYQYNKAEALDQLEEMQQKMLQEIAKCDNTSDDVLNANDANEQEREETVKAKGKKEVLPEYRKLKKEYPDMYGYISIDGIKDFNFVVMYTPDDLENHNFYEDKDWNGNKVVVGTSVWIDGQTSDETENVIIYGHSIKNFKMFGLLKLYKEKSFYEDHRYIRFDTLYEKRMYQIIAVSPAVVYYDEEPPKGTYLFYEHRELDNKDDFDAYINNIKETAFYEIDTTAEFGDDIITLTTCDKSIYDKDRRLIVVAKKI